MNSKQARILLPVSPSVLRPTPTPLNLASSSAHTLAESPCFTSSAQVILSSTAAVELKNADVSLHNDTTLLNVKNQKTDTDNIRVFEEKQLRSHVNQNLENNTEAESVSNFSVPYDIKNGRDVYYMMTSNDDESSTQRKSDQRNPCCNIEPLKLNETKLEKDSSIQNTKEQLEEAGSKQHNDDIILKDENPYAINWSDHPIPKKLQLINNSSPRMRYIRHERGGSTSTILSDSSRHTDDATHRRPFLKANRRIPSSSKSFDPRRNTCHYEPEQQSSKKRKSDHKPSTSLGCSMVKDSYYTTWRPEKDLVLHLKTSGVVGDDNGISSNKSNSNSRRKLVSRRESSCSSLESNTCASVWSSSNQSMASSRKIKQLDDNNYLHHPRKEEANTKDNTSDSSSLLLRSPPFQRTSNDLRSRKSDSHDTLRGNEDFLRHTKPSEPPNSVARYPNVSASKKRGKGTPQNMKSCSPFSLEAVPSLSHSKSRHTVSAETTNLCSSKSTRQVLYNDTNPSKKQRNVESSSEVTHSTLQPTQCSALDSSNTTCAETIKHCLFKKDSATLSDKPKTLGDDDEDLTVSEVSAITAPGTMSDQEDNAKLEADGTKQMKEICQNGVSTYETSVLKATTSVTALKNSDSLNGFASNARNLSDCGALVDKRTSSEDEVNSLSTGSPLTPLETVETVNDDESNKLELATSSSTAAAKSPPIPRQKRTAITEISQAVFFSSTTVQDSLEQVKPVIPAARSNNDDYMTSSETLGSILNISENSAKIVAPATKDYNKYIFNDNSNNLFVDQLQNNESEMSDKTGTEMVSTAAVLKETVNINADPNAIITGKYVAQKQNATKRGSTAVVATTAVKRSKSDKKLVGAEDLFLESSNNTSTQKFQQEADATANGHIVGCSDEILQRGNLLNEENAEEPPSPSPKIPKRLRSSSILENVNASPCLSCISEPSQTGASITQNSGDDNANDLSTPVAGKFRIRIPTSRRLSSTTTDRNQRHQRRARDTLTSTGTHGFVNSTNSSTEQPSQCTHVLLLDKNYSTTEFKNVCQDEISGHALDGMTNHDISGRKSTKKLKKKRHVTMSSTTSQLPNKTDEKNEYLDASFAQPNNSDCLNEHKRNIVEPILHDKFQANTETCHSPQREALSYKASTSERILGTLPHSDNTTGTSWKQPKKQLPLDDVTTCKSVPSSSVELSSGCSSSSFSSRKGFLLKISSSELQRTPESLSGDDLDNAPLVRPIMKQYLIPSRNPEPLGDVTIPKVVTISDKRKKRKHRNETPLFEAVLNTRKRRKAATPALTGDLLDTVTETSLFSNSIVDREEDKHNVIITRSSAVKPSTAFLIEKESLDTNAVDEASSLDTCLKSGLKHNEELKSPNENLDVTLQPRRLLATAATPLHSPTESILNDISDKGDTQSTPNTIKDSIFKSNLSQKEEEEDSRKDLDSNLFPNTVTYQHNVLSSKERRRFNRNKTTDASLHSTNNELIISTSDDQHINTTSSIFPSTTTTLLKEIKETAAEQSTTLPYNEEKTPCFTESTDNNISMSPSFIISHQSKIEEDKYNNNTSCSVPLQSNINSYSSEKNTLRPVLNNDAVAVSDITKETMVSPPTSRKYDASAVSDIITSNLIQSTDSLLESETFASPVGSSSLSSSTTSLSNQKSNNNQQRSLRTPSSHISKSCNNQPSTSKKRKHRSKLSRITPSKPSSRHNNNDGDLSSMPSFIYPHDSITIKTTTPPLTTTMMPKTTNETDFVIKESGDQLLLDTSSLSPLVYTKAPSISGGSVTSSSSQPRTSLRLQIPHTSLSLNDNNAIYLWSNMPPLELKWSVHPFKSPSRSVIPSLNRNSTASSSISLLPAPTKPSSTPNAHTQCSNFKDRHQFSQPIWQRYIHKENILNKPTSPQQHSSMYNKNSQLNESENKDKMESEIKLFLSTRLSAIQNASSLTKNQRTVIQHLNPLLPKMQYNLIFEIHVPHLSLSPTLFRHISLESAENKFVSSLTQKGFIPFNDNYEKSFSNIYKSNHEIQSSPIFVLSKSTFIPMLSIDALSLPDIVCRSYSFVFNPFWFHKQTLESSKEHQKNQITFNAINALQVRLHRCLPEAGLLLRRPTEEYFQNVYRLMLLGTILQNDLPASLKLFFKDWDKHYCIQVSQPLLCTPHIQNTIINDKSTETMNRFQIHQRNCRLLFSDDNSNTTNNNILLCYQSYELHILTFNNVQPLNNNNISSSSSSSLKSSLGEFYDDNTLQVYVKTLSSQTNNRLSSSITTHSIIQNKNSNHVFSKVLRRAIQNLNSKTINNTIEFNPTYLHSKKQTLININHLTSPPSSSSLNNATNNNTNHLIRNNNNNTSFVSSKIINDNFENEIDIKNSDDEDNEEDDTKFDLEAELFG